MNKFVPIFLNILSGDPVFISTSPEQKIRNYVLEILHRLPLNTAPEATEPHAVSIVDKCLQLVRTENEDNAVLCLKIIMDFERHHVKTLASRAQPFLDLILELFDSMAQTVHDTFDTAQAADGASVDSSTFTNSPRPGSPVASTTSSIGTEPGSEQQTTRQLVKATQSFKVVAECPIIVVSIFQAHRNLQPENVQKYTPRIKAALQLQAAPQRAAHEEAQANNTIFTGVAKEIKNRAAFGELITAQVKTMSFLAYLLRAHQSKLTDFLNDLPTIVVRLLQDCPREKSATRKELLVAIRHIINFNFRQIFLPKIIELLDERTLVGDGLTAYETLRPLAYTMLADLIHHVRDHLKPDQIRATVIVYIRNLHDDIPGTSYQTMSAKLLLNMAECMSKIENKQDARHYMMLVLNGIADKFAAMNRQYPNAVKLSRQQQAPNTVDAVPENYIADKDQPPDWDEIDIFSATPIKTVNPRDRSTDPVTENKFLFKNLLHGLKTFFYQLRNSNSPKMKEEMDQNSVPVNWADLSYGFSAEEVNVLIKLFREGTQVFKYYSLDKAEVHSTSPEMLVSQHMASSGKEEKDLLETFATIFHHLDPATFHEVSQSEIPFLYEQSFEHTGLLHIPQFLLASEATSPAFCGMLLQYLMNKIEEVGTKDTLKSSILLRLFKLSFMAVTLFAPQNEQVLLPHVNKLITKSIELSVTAEEPLNYFLLLRSLFRSIGGGRFEHLYKDILPLLEMLLQVLNNLLITAQKPEHRDLFVELSLTVPARLSHLLPHLSYLMRPVVVALRAGHELIAQGLRTLELCIDNLTADYLDPIMAPVIDELMSALWDHLKPNPYSHFLAHTTMRILGKLGGRNRKFMNAPPELTYKSYSDDEPSFDVRLIGSAGARAMPARLGIDVAVDKLRETPKQATAKKADDFHKTQALKLIISHVKLLIGYDNLPEDLARLVRLQANDLCEKKYDSGTDLFAVSQREKSVAKRDAQQETLLKLLKACMLAASIPSLADDAKAFLHNVYRHFMVVELGTSVGAEKQKRRAFDVRAGEGPVYIETGVLADAITESLSSDQAVVREVAEEAMKACKAIAGTMFGSDEKAEHLPFFGHLAETFVHSCYEEEWFLKSGGTAGINIIIEKMGFSDQFLIDHQLDFVRALLYVIKDMPQDLPASIRIQAKDTLLAHIKRCASNYKADQLEDKESKLHILCNRLIGEVSHMNKHVRHAAQEALRTAAEAVGVKIHDVVKPVKDLLLAPIFNKPLRALPFPAQIGYIDAINFCLDMENDVLTFDEQLNRLLYETLALVDADDESLAAKPSEHRNSEFIVNLRVACLRLLTTAIRFPGFNTQQQTQHRARIISIFFRSLYSKNKDVAGAANAGLKIVLAATQKLPKDLLQNGLRPILMNVQDPRKLSVEGLEGLRTLLQLLTNYFKVEIGTRLLDHMKTIAEPATLQKVSFTLVESHPKMKVVTAIFSVFHLLPPAAVQFLPELVDRVIKLESSLRRTRASPFREPLFQYLNHYSNEAWQYFRNALADESKGRFFAQALAHELSGPLREKVISEMDAFVEQLTATEGSDAKAQTAVNGIHIAYSICQFPEPRDKLLGNEKVRKALFSVAKSLQHADHKDQLPSNLRLASVQASEQLMRLMTMYLEQKPDDLDSLFEILEACTADELPKLPSLFEYLYKYVIMSESIEYQRSVLSRCIDTYTNRQSTQALKWFVFHYVLNPILANDVMRNWDTLFATNNKGTTLLDRAMTDQIHNKLWKPQSTPDISDDSTQGVDHSRMELLQTTAFLIKYHHNMLQDARKDIIKFGWNYIRLDDVINKYAAYVLIAYFIANYETPSKIALQVYGALLRAHQAEGKNLVMQSLEILEPVLKKRLGGPDGRQAMWSKMPRRILSEESSNVAQLTSIYQFLVRHPDLFYEAREGFAVNMIQSINKIATLPNSSSENRKLALNLVSLIWKWEERTIREQGSLAGTDSPSADKAGSPQGAGKRGAVAPANLRLLLVKYLVQFIATLPERFPLSSPKPKESPQSSSSYQQPSTDTVVKATDLLYKLLSPPFWDDLDIDAMFPKVTEQILCNDQKTEDKAEVWTTRIINTIQILKVLLNTRSDEWVVERLPQLQKLLAKPLRSDNIEVQEALHGTELPEEAAPKLPPVLQRALEVIPLQQPDDELPDAESPTEEFKTFLNTAASDSLNGNSHMAGINILWALAQRRSEDIVQHIEALLKAFQTKLAKDHLNTQITPQQAQQQGLQQQNILSPQESEVTVNLIIKTIDMLSGCISALVDRRRPYLSVLASLVERSNDNKLCEKILDQVETWVFNPTEPVPTLKEKTAVLQKMLLFEARPDNTMYMKFMNLVIRIYEDPKILRSELAVRMEQAFLIGLRSPDIDMRARFMTIFDRALSRTTSNRFFKLISEQQWEVLGDSFWLSQIIQLMFGSIDPNTSLHLHHDDFKCLATSRLYSSDARAGELMLDDGIDGLISSARHFMNEVGSVKAKDILVPLSDLQHTDWQLAHDVWVAYFPMAWSVLSKDDREDIEQGLISLLTKDMHQRQVDKRPNCVSTLLEGIARARPVCKFPPHVMKFLAKNYNAWYVALTSMEENAYHPVLNMPTVKESNLDALTELYAGLEESDLFYGTWRRRSQFVETNAALSYEQNGIWDKAQQMYEQAQVKARTGSLPFSQGEYMLWEDQWVLCAQKLQQWEVLGDFAKHENINDLYLEATWRSFEAWNSAEQREQLDSIIKAVSDAPTPRRMFFQAFMSLLKLHNKNEQPAEFARICDENIQLSIKNWHKLPKCITNAHIGLLENFQQLVELHDASVICSSLSQTNAGNLDNKSQELKVLLSTWRDRLPNLWDDINAWQDLVTWRQHIFQLINGTYLNLLPAAQGNATGNSYAYRGYHETAWIINRFAHVARKHQMPEVCINQLSKIYTLPNIEIQEAFLKLREQAKCHYQNRSELTSGLDVINNTNLNYFGQQQKAEFYTLKGMFLSKLSQKEDAHDAFGTALFFDIKLPKAWAEWGRYSDQLFKEDPNNLELAGNALSCYLEAAGQYKSAKSRKLLSRILWLLSLDDAEGTLAKTYGNFKGETPLWYWVSFIPQLLNNLSRSEGEANIAHEILTKLAKTYPQALHFQLRTSHEDMQVIRRAQQQKEQKEKAAKKKQQEGGDVKTEGSPPRPESASASRPDTAAGEQSQSGAAGEGTPSQKQESQDGANGAADPARPKKPWEHTEALVITLRTAFPLLYASMEAMVEQIQKYFKCPPDEDAYRLIVALLNDALSYVSRSPHAFAQDSKLPQQTEANITRFAESILPPHIRKAFEQDFVTKKPTMFEYIGKLRKWRDKLAEKLDRRPSTFHLDQVPHLSGFRFVWFDEVEVPGQYLQHRDKNQDFIRIERFLPIVDLVRGVSSCHRRIKIRGHDGSVHPFAIQHPAPRHSRREERILQLFRMFNATLAKKKESRRRNLQFHLPFMVPLSPQIRMIQDDTSYITLQGIYDDYCRRNDMDKDQPTVFTMERMRNITPNKQDQYQNIRLEALHTVQNKYVPTDLVREYFGATFPSYDAFWLFRRQFSYQLAALTYITYTMFMTQRYPNKMSIARRTGNIWGSELLPMLSPSKPLFITTESVPFRFTPNLQKLIGPIHQEGIFTCALMAIARCLTADSSYSTTTSTPGGAAPANGIPAPTAPDSPTSCELSHALSIFIRDEMTFWYTSSHRQSLQQNELRENVQRNADNVVNRALALAREPGANNLPANQSVVDFVAKATNPEKLSQMDLLWMPWL